MLSRFDVLSARLEARNPDQGAGLDRALRDGAQMVAAIVLGFPILFSIILGLVSCLRG